MEGVVDFLRLATACCFFWTSCENYASIPQDPLHPTLWKVPMRFSGPPSIAPLPLLGIPSLDQTFFALVLQEQLEAQTLGRTETAPLLAGLLRAGHSHHPLLFPAPHHLGRAPEIPSLAYPIFRPAFLRKISRSLVQRTSSPRNHILEARQRRCQQLRFVGHHCQRIFASRHFHGSDLQN